MVFLSGTMRNPAPQNPELVFGGPLEQQGSGFRQTACFGQEVWGSLWTLCLSGVELGVILLYFSSWQHSSIGKIEQDMGRMGGNISLLTTEGQGPSYLGLSALAWIPSPGAVHSCLTV